MASRIDTQLAIIESNEYKPTYDVNTDSYKDICPYLPYQRSRIEFSCSCASNAYFKSTGQFNQHIKSKTHKRWLSYTHPKNVEKDRVIKALNKEIRILNQQLEVQNRRLKKSNEQKNKQRKIINQLRKEKKCKKA